MSLNVDSDIEVDVLLKQIESLGRYNHATLIEKEELLSEIAHICLLIQSQAHLKHQDAWLADMIKRGLYEHDVLPAEDESR